MSGLFEVHDSQDKIDQRRVLFALELLDAVTLSRVSQGVKVEAQGLQGKPIVNVSGLFVWLDEDIGRLQKISIDPRTLPYEEAELDGAQLKLPLHTIELSPRVDYPFDAGITGLRGTLVEKRVPIPQPPEPVVDAEVRLRWADQDGIWHDAPTLSHTNTKGGDFVAILRLSRSDDPHLDATGELTARLHVLRGALGERNSADLKLVPGRFVDASSSNPLIFAWDEMQP
jgi:hypothetical protein